MERNEYALITGGTSGIGYELARCFAKDNYQLVLVARHQEDLDRVQQELEKKYGIQVITIQKDLIDPEAPKAIYEELKTRKISIDVLVNNASQGQFGLFLENDPERELDLIQLNIMSYVLMSKLFMADMLARGSGKVLNVGSIAGDVPGPYHAVYHGTKAFINSWSMSIRDEVKEKGLTVTLLMPGVTDTDFFNKADMNDSRILQDQEPADPAKVARDGYQALMDGDASIISGLKNKMQIAMTSVMPDKTVAKMMRKQQEPVSDKERKKREN